MRLRNVFTLIVLVLLRSIFLYGLNRMRKGYTFLSIVHLVFVLMVINLGVLPLIAYTIPVFLMYIINKMILLPLYTYIVSSIPGLWMALTQFALDLVNNHIDVVKYLTIYFRVVLVSLNILFLLHTFNPFELSVFFERFGSGFGMYFVLFIRIASFLTKEAIELIHTHGVKGVSVWKTLAMLLLRGDEVAKYFSESTYIKRKRFSPRPCYDYYMVIAQLIIVLYDAVMYILSSSILQLP